MADTPTDVNDAEVQFEQVFAEDDQATSTKDSSPEETKPDVEKVEETPPAETEGESSDQEDTKPGEESDETEQPQGKAEERKQQLNTEIRDLVSQRNELKAEVERINAQVYQPATEEELQEQGMSPEMAAIEAMKQQNEMRDFNTQVADAQLTLESESNRVMSDFPIFNPGSPEFNAEIASEAGALLKQALITDPNSGQVIGSNISPYQLYKTLAAAHSTSAAQGQIKGQKATEQMLASADAKGSASPSKPKVDPILAILEDA